MLKITPFICDKFKLDGGACFGTIPKTIWSKLATADNNNLITIVNRCLIVEDNDRVILIDSGIGNKQSTDFLQYYFLSENYKFDSALKKTGYKYEDITDVIHTHLHFDHCGNSVSYNKNGELHPTFPNAKYWVGKAHWDSVQAPNKREAAAFLPENYMPLFDNKKLFFIEDKITEFSDHITLKTFEGHTSGQLVPYIKTKKHTLVYCADFIPSSAYIPIHYVAGYDLYPVVSMKEKEAFVKEAYENKYVLMFEHDPAVECCRLTKTKKGIRGNEFKSWEYFDKN